MGYLWNKSEIIDFSYTYLGPNHLGQLTIALAQRPIAAIDDD
jgi:hypothetical protein